MRGGAYVVVGGMLGGYIGGGMFGGGVCLGREYIGGYVGGGGRGLLRWGTLGGGGTFWALFGKVLHIGKSLHFGCPWMNLFVRVLQKFANC